MASALSFVREHVPSLGLFNTWLYGLARLLDKTTRGRCRIFKYYFVAQPVPAQPPVAVSGKSRTRIYLATAKDPIVQVFPRPSDVIARRFADGAICVVAEQEDRLVGFIWIKQGGYEEDEVRCHYLLRPEAGLAWDFDGYVSPEFRMSLAFARLWQAANDFLRTHGCEWSISRISAFNAASLAAHKRLGTVHLHTGVFLKLGGTQFAGFTCTPYVHIAIGPKARPEITFSAPPTRASEG